MSKLTLFGLLTIFVVSDVIKIIGFTLNFIRQTVLLIEYNLSLITKRKISYQRQGFFVKFKLKLLFCLRLINSYARLLIRLLNGLFVFARPVNPLSAWLLYSSFLRQAKTAQHKWNSMLESEY